MSRPTISYPSPIAGPSSSVYSNPSAPPSAVLAERDREYASAPQRGPSGSRVPGPGGSVSSLSRAAGALDTNITRLLVTTKQLLQGLELWAAGQMSETEISDIYVRLGDGFEICVKQFRQVGLSTQDLDTIPDDLRECLEEALACDPSQETMQQYLPTIRDIISMFLNGLKTKQASYRRALTGTARESPPLPVFPPSAAASASHNPYSQPHPPKTHQNSRSVSPRPNLSPNHPPAPLPQPPRPEMNDLRQSIRSASSSGSIAPQSIGGAGGVGISANGSGNGVQVSPTTQAQLGLGGGIQGSRIPSSQALAERQRGDRAAPTRPAPPDAFRPPRTRPPEPVSVMGPGGPPASRGAGTSTPSPSSHHAPLPPQHALPHPPPASAPSDGLIRHQLSDNPMSAPIPSPSFSGALTSTPLGLSGPNLLPPLATGPPASKPLPLHDRFSRDSLGNPRPVSRFSADSDITNGSPIRSPNSRSPPVTLQPLPEIPESATLPSFPSSAHSISETVSVEEQDSGGIPTLPTLNLPSTDLSDSVMAPDSDSKPTLMPSADINSLSGPAQRSLAALGSVQLERRASKRFSSYTYQKLLPGSPGNHKKSNLGSPQRPARRGERAPPLPALPALSEVTGNADANTRRRSFLGSEAEGRGGAGTGRERSDTGSSMGQTNGSQKGSSSDRLAAHPHRSRSPSASSGTDHSFKDASDGDGEGEGNSMRILRTPEPDADPDAHPTPRPGTDLPPAMRPETASERPTTGSGPMGVYLQIGRQVRKASLDLPVSLGDLRLLFMERFEYDPGMENFPDVYLRDNRTGVQYELEDMEDLREGCVLSLDIEPLDQVKQHFDTTFASMMTELREVKLSLEQAKKQSALHAPSHLAVSPSQQPTKTLKSPVIPHTESSAPSAAPSPSSEKKSLPAPGRPISPGQVNRLRAQQEELANLRRDLAVMRQTHVDFLSDTKESFTRLREQNASMRQVVNTKLGGSRALLDTSKTKLDTLGPDVLSAVNDVSDLIDQAREDVYRRSVTPAKNQMAKIARDLQAAREAVEQFSKEVSTAEPIWRATWHQELARVMDEQKALPYHHKFKEDLEKDVKDAEEMWTNVTEYVSQRQATGGIGRGNSSRFRPPTPDEDGGPGIPHLLMEIRTKEGDPASRLKAIEAQQRAREKDMATRPGDEFSEELAGFVAGKKLKKTGGTDEAERAWQRRHEKALKRMLSDKIEPPPFPGSAMPNVSAGASAGMMPAGGDRGDKIGTLSPQMTGSGMRGGQALSPQMTGTSAQSARSYSSNGENEAGG